MKYIRPDYIDKLPATFQDYFNEENFKNRPYPRTLENANDYLLHEVFKVDTTENIVVFSLDENGGLKEKLSDYNRENFHELFSYNIWKNIQDGTKIVALYWLYEEICEELKIYKPKFFFLDTKTDEDSNVAGFYQPSDHSFHVFLNEAYTSAFQYIEIIAHELKHAQFFSKEPSKYMNRLNYDYYFDLPEEKDYDLENDREKFEFNYNLAFYYQQPNEVESYNYGIKKAKEIFKEGNFKVKNGKLTNELKSSASLEDLNFFRNNNMNRREYKRIFKYVFQENFKEQMDKHFLANEFIVDISNIADKICKLDPNVKQKGDKLIPTIENDQINELLNKYEEAKKNFYNITKEIKNDKKKLFKKYKQLLADENIVEYRT